jgi:hypothetical protein
MQLLSLLRANRCFLTLEFFSREFLNLSSINRCWMFMRERMWQFLDAGKQQLEAFLQ